MKESDMTREELIACCRYYTGGNDDPVDPFRNYERCWVSFVLNDPIYIAEVTNTYLIYGLEDFSVDDGVPLSLKAVLFNRYTHWSCGYYTIDGFKEWYLKEYLQVL